MKNSPTSIITSNVPYLDGWRGLAIIFVLIGHFAVQIGAFRTFYFGPLGVQLFFVLSGFFMGKILFIRKTALIPFFARRFIRIVPTFWVYISFIYLFFHLFQSKPYHISLAELLPTYFFLSTYLPVTLSIWSNLWPNGHLWSLNVEEHCYIYLALGAFLTARASTIYKFLFLAGSVIIVLLITILYVLGVISSPVASPFRTHTEVASLGLLASAAYVTLRPQRNFLFWNKSPLIPLFSLAIAIVIFIPNRKDAESLNMIISPVFAAIAVNHAENFPLWIKKLLSSRILVWFGRCSFSLYLWQQPFHFLVINSGLPHVIGVVSAISTGILSFYLIENPSRNYLIGKLSTYQQRRSNHQLASTSQLSQPDIK